MSGLTCCLGGLGGFEGAVLVVVVLEGRVASMWGSGCCRTGGMMEKAGRLGIEGCGAAGLVVAAGMGVSLMIEVLRLALVCSPSPGCDASGG